MEKSPTAVSKSWKWVVVVPREHRDSFLTCSVDEIQNLATGVQFAIGKGIEKSSLVQKFVLAGWDPNAIEWYTNLAYSEGVAFWPQVEDADATPDLAIQPNPTFVTLRETQNIEALIRAKRLSVKYLMLGLAIWLVWLLSVVGMSESPQPWLIGLLALASHIMLGFAAREMANYKDFSWHSSNSFWAFVAGFFCGWFAIGVLALCRNLAPSALGRPEP